MSGRNDLHPDTYSPLRDKYPDGNLSLSVGELLKYTLHLSDNNACDILFRVFGGPAATDEYLRSMGLRDFAIEVTEDDMHRNLADCYRNWTTPLEAVRLLEWLVSGKAAKGAYRDFIEQTMISCQTGRDRLLAPLAGTKAVIGTRLVRATVTERDRLSGQTISVLFSFRTGIVTVLPC